MDSCSSNQKGPLAPDKPRHRPPDLSIPSEDTLPRSPVDSAYQTGGLQAPDGSQIPDRFTFAHIETEETLLDFPEMADEVDDDVFLSDEELDMEKSESIERPLAMVPVARNRAFSFPMTLSDVQFSVAPGLPLSGLSIIQRNHFGSRIRIASLRGSPWQIGGSGDYYRNEEEDADDEDFSAEDIDDEELKPSFLLHPRLEPRTPSSSRYSVSPSAVPNISSSRELVLPDLILSGTRTGAVNHSHLDAPDGIPVSDPNSVEFQIACRLAKIGDEFDAKLFGSKRDSVDGGSLLGGMSFTSAYRLWSYLTNTGKENRRKYGRQRSHSTTD